MAEPPVTGTDVLRRTVKARNKSPHALWIIASDLDGVSASTLEDFAAGKADLSVEHLKALTKELYPHAEFDADSGMLTSANKVETRPFGAHPPRFVPPQVDYSKSWPGPQPVGNSPEKPKVTTSRPGWLSGW